MTQDTERVVPETVTLGVLWRRYQHECQAFLDNTARTRDDATARAKVLLAYFGAERDVRALTTDDQAAYAAARRAGGIVIGKDRVTRPVRARSAEVDLALLHMMLNWAATVRLNGKRWLDGNPLAGVRREREENPRRPVATWDRFRATRRAMQKLARRAATDAERVRWIKLELALVLAEGTGRRLGSIRQLRWDDVDWTASTIRWRAEADKKRRESVVPMPPKLAAEVRQFRRRLGVLGGWVFAAELNPNVPMDRHLFDKWLAHAERVARLPKLVGGLWHPYRRKWATERKHLSIKDVAAAGGWRDTATLLTCYAQPDNETLLAVMSEKRKLRTLAVSAANG
jgi:integrase